MHDARAFLGCLHSQLWVPTCVVYSSLHVPCNTRVFVVINVFALGFSLFWFCHRQILPLSLSLSLVPVYMPNCGRSSCGVWCSPVCCWSRLVVFLALWNVLFDGIYFGVDGPWFDLFKNILLGFIPVWCNDVSFGLCFPWPLWGFYFIPRVFSSFFHW